MMVLSALVLRPLPAEVADRVEELSRAIGIDDDLLRTVGQFATSDRALAAVDFERNGYTAGWSADRAESLTPALGCPKAGPRRGTIQRALLGGVRSGTCRPARSGEECWSSTRQRLPTTP